MRRALVVRAQDEEAPPGAQHCHRVTPSSLQEVDERCHGVEDEAQQQDEVEARRGEVLVEHEEVVAEVEEDLPRALGREAPPAEVIDDATRG